MADTKIRTRKATSLLKEDHRKVKKLFAEFEKLDESDTAEMARIFETVNQELTVHAQIEEEIFYPACEMAEDEDAKTLVKEAHEEHKIVKTLLQEIDALEDGDHTECDAKMKVLRDNVLHHAEEEEEEIFPIFDGLDKEQKTRVAEQLISRKQELQSQNVEKTGGSEESDESEETGDFDERE